jgi:hypothetical protein
MFKEQGWRNLTQNVNYPAPLIASTKDKNKFKPTYWRFILND